MEEGIKHFKGVAFLVMSESPRSVDYAEQLHLPDRLLQEARKFQWVQDARVRVREEGRVYFGEIFVVPKDDKVGVEELDAATRRLYEMDWRIQDSS